MTICHKYIFHWHSIHSTANHRPYAQKYIPLILFQWQCKSMTQMPWSSSDTPSLTMWPDDHILPKILVNLVSNNILPKVSQWQSLNSTASQWPQATKMKVSSSENFFMNDQKKVRQKISWYARLVHHETNCWFNATKIHSIGTLFMALQVIGQVSQIEIWWAHIGGNAYTRPHVTKIYSIDTLSMALQVNTHMPQKYIPMTPSQWQDRSSAKCHKNTFHWLSFNSTASRWQCATKIYPIDTLSMGLQVNDQMPQKYIPLTLFQ